MVLHKIQAFLFIILFTSSNVIRTNEYIYPIAQIDTDSLLVMHQKSLYNIELIKWDAQTKDKQKMLWSIYMPSSVKLLPNKSGFSFIDQGRIRIKQFCKRSPKTVNIYDPITNFDSIEWIDNNTFYFTAEDPYFNNVFVCEVQKNIASVSRLTFQEETDFLYPQKVNDELFVIKKDPSNIFSVVRLPWKERAFENYKEISEEVLIESDKSCCFLKMIDENNGYFISYIPEKDAESNLYTFWCNQLYRNESGNWEYKELFYFKIDEKYIMGKGEARMYESIKPLLPRYEKNGIFFSHFDGCKHCCSLLKYSLDTEAIESIPTPHRKCTSIFTPLVCDEQAYCGMMIEDHRSASYEDETFQIDIYKIST